MNERKSDRNHMSDMVSRFTATKCVSHAHPMLTKQTLTVPAPEALIGTQQTPRQLVRVAINDPERITVT